MYKVVIEKQEWTGKKMRLELPQRKALPQNIESIRPKARKFQISAITLTKSAVMFRHGLLILWLLKRGKRQAQLLKGGRAVQAVNREIVKWWIDYQRYVEKHGHPSGAAFGRAIGIAPSEARGRLKLLAFLESDGPWREF